MTITRTTSRTQAGRFLPLASALLTTLFLVLIAQHSNYARWLGMDVHERQAAVGLALFGTVAVEMSVLRQKRLIIDGEVTEAVVDDVRPLSWSPEHATADYHFFTEDGRVITSRCAVPTANAEFWQRGRKITAIYDPARPARHAIDERLWAVQWQISEAA